MKSILVILLMTIVSCGKGDKGDSGSQGSPGMPGAPTPTPEVPVTPPVVINCVIHEGKKLVKTCQIVYSKNHKKLQEKCTIELVNQVDKTVTCEQEP